MYKIQFDPMDTRSITAAIKQLEHYRTYLLDTIEQILLDMAKMGATQIDFYLAANEAVSLGNYDISNAVFTKQGDGYVVSVSGTDLLFLEFGAGDTVSSEGIKHGYGPGSWSSSPAGSGKYAKNGFWYYGGQMLKGLPPAEAFPTSAKVIRDSLGTIVENNFNRR